MALRVFTKLKPERFTDDQKAQIINECVDNHVSPLELAKKYPVNADTIRAWVHNAGKTLPQIFKKPIYNTEVQNRGGTSG